jgi:HYDIN/CFA65/VesB family protein
VLSHRELYEFPQVISLFPQTGRLNSHRAESESVRPEWNGRIPEEGQPRAKSANKSAWPCSRKLGTLRHLSVTFTPTAPGTRVAVVSIIDDASNSPQSVSLSGTGIPPVVTLSPTSLNFGNQLLGSTSPSQNVKLSTNGSLSIASITTSAQFAQTNNCGNSLAARGNCAIAVTFTPAALGIQNGTLTVSDSGANSPQTVPLSGTGVQPAVRLSPTSLSFPTQVVFVASSPHNVTLTNSGTGTLTITSVAVTGDFSQTNTCGTSVGAGANCTINVRFRPTSIGTLTGSVSVIDNAPGSPQKVTLRGTGTYIQLTPTSVNFGNQPVGTKSLPKTITLSNKGSVAVSISGISITGTNVSDFAPTNTCGTSVAAGASCFIKVTFTPSATGKRTAQVSVSDDGGGSPQKVTVNGTGT